MTFKQQSKTFLNTAGTGLISEDSTKAAIDHLNRMTANIDDETHEWRFHQLARCKNGIAEILSCSANDVIVAPSFSYAYHAVLSSLPRSSTVLYLENDYPSLTLPIELGGFNSTRLPSSNHFDLGQEAIEKELNTGRHDVLILSHVQYLTGFSLDLESLCKTCRSTDTMLILDATQSFSATRISPAALGIDVLIASHYKWLNAGFGTACMYMVPSFVQKHQPTIAGYGSMNFEVEPPSYTTSILAYQPGQLSSASTYVLENALNERLIKGVDQVQAYNSKLMEHFLLHLGEKARSRLLGEANMKNRLGISCFTFTSDEYEQLTNNHSFTYRNGIGRISFHINNTMDEAAATANSINQLFKDT